MLSADERRTALSLSRRAIERALGPDPAADPAAPFRAEALPRVFDERRGVFVTLKRVPGDDLRGCVGYPLPVLPLRSGLPRAAVAAATEDPRFRPVRASELPRLAIEVSVLTVPVPVRAARPRDLVAAVTVGRDGLIVDAGGASGLLLPQVAVEMGWTAEEFLDGACEKAGLDRGAWRAGATVRRFEAEVVRETPVGRAAPVGDADVTPGDGRPAPRT